MFNINDTNYVSLAVRTEAPTGAASLRLQNLKLLQYICDRAISFSDQAVRLDEIKKFVFYGKDISFVTNTSLPDDSLLDSASRLANVQTARIFHGALGIATESGELIDAISSHIYNGKPLDFPNICEELGDLLWYIAILCDACQYPLQEVMGRNIAKLRARYPDKFTEDAAINRNLTEERATLTDGTDSGTGTGTDSNTNGGQPTNG